MVPLLQLRPQKYLLLKPLTSPPRDSQLTHTELTGSDMLVSTTEPGLDITEPMLDMLDTDMLDTHTPELMDTHMPQLSWLTQTVPSSQLNQPMLSLPVLTTWPLMVLQSLPQLPQLPHTTPQDSLDSLLTQMVPSSQLNPLM